MLQSPHTSTLVGTSCPILWRTRPGRPSYLEHRRHVESTRALESGGLELEAQFARTAPGTIKLRVRRAAGDLCVFVPVLGTRRIAEIVGMELRHHIHRRCR